MKNVRFWIIIGAIALFVLGLFGGMFMPFGGNHSTFGYGCVNGYGMMPFGFLGMAFMWLIPLGILALIVGGIFWLVHTLTQKQASPS